MAASKGKAAQAGKQGKAAPVLCAFCNKPIKAGQHGALCAKNVKAGWQQGKRLALKAALSVSSIPAGYITIAALHKQVTSYNLLSVSRMVKLTGSDGVINTPAHAITTPVFYNGTRYVSGWLASKAGMLAMQAGNFSSASISAWQQAWYAYVQAAQQAALAGKAMPKQPTMAAQAAGSSAA